MLTFIGYCLIRYIKRLEEMTEHAAHIRSSTDLQIFIYGNQMLVHVQSGFRPFFAQVSYFAQTFTPRIIRT